MICIRRFPLRLAMLMIMIASQSSLLVHGQYLKAKWEMPKRSCTISRSLPLDFRANTKWDAERIYHQLVVLVSFADCEFRQEDPKAFYNAIFNQHNYNPGNGPGCVADYFRDQSSRYLNIQFDLIGPIKVGYDARSDGGSTMRQGTDIFRETAQKLVEENPEIDWSVYDWYGDYRVSQIVFVYAGYIGNNSNHVGYIWPTTDEFAPIETPDGYTISVYSSSGELWGDGTSCGIGPICHEFSHCLSLPDVYPTLASLVESPSVVDEWDLMDGGSYTGKGWCPPNYSPLEKMLLGWLNPVELKEDTIITDLRPVAEGGDVFIVFHTDSEFYLIENRQQSGWDFGLPGRGLLVYHVDYNKYAWGANSINNEAGHPMYSIVTADNLNFIDWYRLLLNHTLKSQYVNQSQQLNSNLMSSAAYPWYTDSTTFVNRDLTASSIPATLMFNADSNGSYYLSKSITNISQNADGTVTFYFRKMKSGDTGISDFTNGYTRFSDNEKISVVHTLQGVRVGRPKEKGIYIRNGHKFIYK